MFKKIFNVSAIRIALEFPKVTKKSISNTEFWVHVRTFTTKESEGIKNMTKDANLTAIIKNYTKSHEVEKLKNITVESANHVDEQLELGTLIYSNSCMHPNSNLNCFLLQRHKIIVNLFIEL